MAMSFEQVVADVIEANEFPQLSQAYAVMSVPKVVVNDRVEILGAVPEAEFVKEVVRAVQEKVEAESTSRADGVSPG